MKKYAMMILGCKVNDYEASCIREKMNRCFEETDFKDKADIYLIFTCCVTNTAEAKTRKFIHDARRNNPYAYIAAIGCMPQVKPDAEVFEDVDLLIGSDHKDEIVDLILSETRENLVSETISSDFEHLWLESYIGKSRSFLKIQDGCDQFCSYCIIPYARGRQRCGDHEKLIEEAKLLAKQNKELVLTGIHTGRYDDGVYDLCMLLEELCKIEGLETIRLSSIEITEVNDRIIDLMKRNEKIAHHLHIPVQSCEDSVLKAMNRPYTIEGYMERVAQIRNEIPDILISTDLITGFPNESDESFEMTLENLKKIRFSFIHVFPYSRKTGTAADRMEGHVDPGIKKERARKVSMLQKTITKQIRKELCGRKVKVLIERCENDCSYGYCREYVYVKIKEICPVGQIVDAVITEAEDEVIAECC